MHTPNVLAARNSIAPAALLPGFYAAALSGDGAITAAAQCPQRYVCPGGRPTSAFSPADPTITLLAADSTIQLCPDGTWTKEPGATSVEQCCE